ncbi:hypothetical protein RI367_000496 [Sorochytrium milnesiophthora]
MADIKTLAQEWLRLDKNEGTRAEIQALLDAGNDAELEQRLRTRIEFGTAGLRARMEAGFARMNDLTVIQATQGLCSYLLSTLQGDASKASVVIGHDHRQFNSLSSKQFALLTATAFLSKGVKVYFFHDLVHTPLVPFAVKTLKASCGIMITASHNPKADNGYKLYWGNGCQIISPVDKNVADAILENLEPWTWDTAVVERAKAEGMCVDPREEMVRKYMQELGELKDTVSQRDAAAPAKLNITYTAMHGVGYPYIKQAFSVFGLPEFATTPEQLYPDPEFPTVAFPNPEEGKGALTLAMQAAQAAKSTLIFANDPDADRLAVAEQQPDGQWQILTGNQIGILLATYLHAGFKKHAKGKKLGTLTTTVSSMMLKQFAKVEGLEFQETLTGFKWLGNAAIDMEKRGTQVIFAYEEAIGFMCGDVVRDKDGVSAAVCFADMAHALYQQGRTVMQRLRELYVQYGYFATNNHYIIEHDGAKIRHMFDKIRYTSGKQDKPSYPPALGPYKILSVRDLTVGYDTTTSDNKPVLPVSASSQMITFTFEVASPSDQVALLPCYMTLRTSGTEPKVKYYTELPGVWNGQRDGVSDEEKVAIIKKVADAALADLVDACKREWLKV